MKKAIAWMLALCLLAMGIPAVAQSGSAPLFDLPDDLLDSLVNFAYDSEQGKIYCLGYEHMYTLNADGSDAQSWEITPMDLTRNTANANLYMGGVYLLEGAPYVLAGVAVYEADQSDVQVEGFGLYELTFDEEAGSVSLQLAIEMDGEELIEYNGDYAYFSLPGRMVQQDGKLYGMLNMMGGTRLIAIDPEASSVRTLEMDNYSEALLPYQDGKLLTVYNEYTGNGTLYHVFAMDAESGDMEEQFVLEPGEGIYPNIFAYDAQNGIFYYEANGELMRVTDMDPQTATSVASCPISYANCVAIASDGSLLVADYESIWKVNTDPDKRPEARLTVQYNYNQAMEAARVAFQQAHPEVEVVLAQSAGDVVQAMMTQTATPDIYTLSVNSAEYSAVFERGYMAELTDNEALSGFVSAVYPAIGEVVSKNGEVYGLPLEAYGYGNLSFSPEALERLGLSQEDVPSTWMEFFDLLVKLPEYLENDENVSVFESYLTQQDVRYILFNGLMDAYMLYISQPENEFAFDTPLFRELMAAFEAVDFAALGVSEEYADDMIYSSRYGSQTLFYSYGSFDPYASMASGKTKTLYLALDEGIEPMVNTSVTVAFVNPFSPNRELATEYLAAASEQIDAIMRITMMPGENEPVLNPYYEENLKSYDEQIASLEAQLETAEDVDKQALEASLEEIKGYRDDFEKNNRYNASEESIARYREVAQYMTVATYIGMDSETSNEYYEQRSQYVDGAITLDEFIRNIDQKLQMIVLEGR